MFKRVIVGISGGVDSAVTALLLKKKGYQVHGVFMQNWDIADEKGACSADEDYKDADHICQKLKIPLTRVNFVKEYWNEVFLNLISDYENGFTPNPDILCNRNVKFRYFYEHAKSKLGADAIATGHYAKTSFGTYLENFSDDRSVKLLKAKDEWKDQTFFLSQIEQEPLKRTMFPLGNLLKSEVKQIAADNGLEKIAAKKESMGICFIGNRDFKEFISEYICDKPGDFVDIDTGKVIGEHRGIHQWTVGQRTRLSGVKTPIYIAKKESQTGTIYVVQGHNHSAYHSTLFFTSPAHWIDREPLELQDREVLTCQYKFQRTHDAVGCEIFKTDVGLVLLSLKTKRAVTPGQYAVLYRGNECLGSARIVDSGPSNFSYYWMQRKGKCRVNWVLNRYFYKDMKPKDEGSLPPLIQLSNKI